MSPNILMPIMIFMTRYYHSSVPRYRILTANIFKFLSLPFLASVLFLASSCEEDPTAIGEKILPESDFVTIKSTDTISVRSFTMYADSIRSENPSYSYIGQLYDPYFGTTTAEFVSQMRLNNTWELDVFTIDSVKLLMSFINVRGNTAAGHSLRLSEISEEIYTDSSYYSNKPVPLTGYSFDVPLPELKADTVNDLVLNLPNEFGTYITRNTSMFFHDNTKPDFRSYFKGFYFQLIPAGNPAFITLSVAPTQQLGMYSNYIVLYMHDANNVASEFYFIFDSFTRNAAFNKYKHDYTTAEPGKKFDETINKDILDTLTYLQGLNGVYTRILLHGLDSIKSNPSLKGISVNRARLIYPYWNKGTGYSQADLPSQLLMRYTDNTGTRYYVPDYATSSSFYDGTIDTVAGVYNFNIGTFIQNYLEDTGNRIKPELDLFIQSSSLQKVIMRANGSSKPVKFEFTYTKF
jgi:hypothetical protein